MKQRISKQKDDLLLIEIAQSDPWQKIRELRDGEIDLMFHQVFCSPEFAFSMTWISICGSRRWYSVMIAGMMAWQRVKEMPIRRMPAHF